MIWPWRKQAAVQEAALEVSEARIHELESNWDVIMQEVIKGRRHRDRNHIMDLVIGVARGNR